MQQIKNMKYDFFFSSWHSSMLNYTVYNIFTFKLFHNLIPSPFYHLKTKAHFMKFSVLAVHSPCKLTLWKVFFFFVFVFLKWWKQINYCSHFPLVAQGTQKTKRFTYSLPLVLPSAMSHLWFTGSLLWLLQTRGHRGEIEIPGLTEEAGKLWKQN